MLVKNWHTSVEFLLEQLKLLKQDSLTELRLRRNQSPLHCQGPYQEDPGVASGWPSPSHKTCLEMEAEFTSAQNIHLHFPKGIPILGSSPCAIIAMLSLIEADVYIRSRKFTWLLLGVLRIFQEICSFVLCSPYPSSVLGIFCFLSFLSLCGLGLASSHMPRSRLPGLAIYFKGETFHFMH